jgi:hypothetical protein
MLAPAGIVRLPHHLLLSFRIETRGERKRHADVIATKNMPLDIVSGLGFTEPDKNPDSENANTDRAAKAMAHAAHPNTGLSNVVD